MYLHIGKECVINSKDIIGIFNIKYIKNTKEYKKMYELLETEKSITEEGLNNSSAWIIPKYSLLYSIYASIGLVAINRAEISTSQAIYGIILKKGVSLEYMYYYLIYFKKNIHRYVETGTQGNLNAKLLKSFEILSPSLEEQEMIVNMLSLADEKIENLEKEISKMNEFKKGLLQQMFVKVLNNVKNMSEITKCLNKWNSAIEDLDQEKQTILIRKYVKRHEYIAIMER